MRLRVYATLPKMPIKASSGCSEVLCYPLGEKKKKNTGIILTTRYMCPSNPVQSPARPAVGVLETHHPRPYTGREMHWTGRLTNVSLDQNAAPSPFLDCRLLKRLRFTFTSSRLP